MARRYEDLTGQQFGRLTAIKYVGTKNSRAQWECVCSCDEANHVIVSAKTLKNGGTRSCGCLHKETAGRRAVYPQWFLDELANEEDKVKASAGKLRTSEKVDFICEKHGVYTQRIIDHIVDGKKTHGCPKCGKHGFDLVGKHYGHLEVLYKNGHDRFNKVLWHCKCDNCGREVDVTTQGLTESSENRTCGKCKIIYTKEHLEGLKVNKLTVKKYIGKSNWECLCECGRKTIKHARDLKSGRAVSCSKCMDDLAHKGSKCENNIKDYLFALCNIDDIVKDRSILEGQEIDIYLPEHKIGIEYNGSVYHASLNNVYEDKPKLYHQQKFLLAKEKGVHLISIFDVDWQNNQEKIKMYLKSLILPQKKLFARKCKLDIVDNDVAVAFVNKYHLQGANKATMKINYGLFVDNKLMAVMSFGRLRLAKHKEGEFELHRYCIKDGYTILGGAERLLKAFERDYSPKYIVSYSDNDYFLGGIYERLKFENVGQSRPRYYWYLYGKELRREQCMLKHLKVSYPALLQEAIEVKASNKEDYVMSKLGASKVYRSGNTKWEKWY